MNRKQLAILYFLLWALILLSGCANFRAQAGTFPTGTYVWEHGDQFQMTWNKDGTFELYYHEDQITTGKYYIDEDVIIWGPDPECLRFNAGSAAYHWSLNDGDLSFKIIGEDNCRGRDRVMGMVWVVKP